MHDLPTGTCTLINNMSITCLLCSIVKEVASSCLGSCRDIKELGNTVGMRLCCCRSLIKVCVLILVGR